MLLPICSEYNFLLSNVKPSSFDPLATPISASTSSGPSYSAAYLSELKAATPGSRPKLSEGDSFTLDEDVVNVDTITPAAVPPEVVDLTGKQFPRQPTSVYSYYVNSGCRHGYPHTF